MKKLCIYVTYNCWILWHIIAGYLSLFLYSVMLHPLLKAQVWDENGWNLPEITGIGLKQLEMAEIVWKWLEVAGNG